MVLKNLLPASNYDECVRRNTTREYPAPVLKNQASECRAGHIADEAVVLGAWFFNASAAIFREEDHAFMGSLPNNDAKRLVAHSSSVKLLMRIMLMKTWFIRTCFVK